MKLPKEIIPDLSGLVKNAIELEKKNRRRTIVLLVIGIIAFIALFVWNTVQTTNTTKENLKADSTFRAIQEKKKIDSLKQNIAKFISHMEKHDTIAMKPYYADSMKFFLRWKDVTKQSLQWRINKFWKYEHKEEIFCIVNGLENQSILIQEDDTNLFIVKVKHRFNDKVFDSYLEFSFDNKEKLSSVNLYDPTFKYVIVPK